MLFKKIVLVISCCFMAAGLAAPLQAQEPHPPVELTFSAQVYYPSNGYWHLSKKWANGFSDRELALKAMQESEPLYSFVLYGSTNKDGETWWYYSHTMEPAGYPQPTQYGWVGNTNIPPTSCDEPSSSINEKALIVNGPREDSRSVSFTNYANNCGSYFDQTLWGWRVYAIREVKSCPAGFQLSEDKSACDCIRSSTGTFEFDSDSLTLEYKNAAPACNFKVNEAPESNQNPMCP